MNRHLWHGWHGYSQQWVRRWRLPEMRLLFLALLVSAAAVSSVGFFTDRVDQAMQKQATQLLGGDLVISSSRPLAEAYRSAAQTRGVQQAEITSFRSMVSAGDKLQLVQVKAVTANYPLQGYLEVAGELGQPGARFSDPAAQQVPAGELWAEARLFNELSVKPGDKVQLGSQQFTLSKVLTKDPGQGSGFFQLAPTVLMPLADLPATGLLSPASRAEFSLLFAGETRQINALRTALKPQLQATEQIRSLDDSVPAVQQALQRAGRFLGLAALLSVVLAGAAIALTAASLVRHETRAVAVLKAFGLSRRTILQDYLLNLWVVALLAGLLGALLGFCLQFLLSGWLAQFIDIVLPAVRPQAAFTGVFTALVMVTGFALPYLLSMVNTSPMQILQGSLQAKRTLLGLIALGILPAVFALLWLQAGELLLAIWLFFGILLALLLFWVATRASLALLARLSLHPRWEWLALLRHSRRSSLLVVVFAMGLFTLLLLTALRTDLIERWQDTLPADAPNYFLVNIQPNEVVPLEAFLQEQGVKAELFPMIRGRLIEVNGKAVKSEDFEDPRAKRLLEREFNLSSFARFPATNKLLAGQWFDGKSSTGFSIEQGIGETLRFALGDSLTFDIAGERYTEPVTSVREVSWDSMQPNFFITAAPGALDDKPRTFITSLYLDPGKPLLVPAMIHRFPGVTAIDTSAVINQIRTLIAQASFAVQGIFAFTLVTGIIVLLAALQSQKPDRRKEIAVLKSLGAVHRVLRRRIWIEFSLLGALAGLMASLFTLLTSNVLGYYLFDLGLSINFSLVLIGTITGALLVGVAAYFNLRGLLGVTPIALLQA